jgi:hypothetical protein
MDESLAAAEYVLGEHFNGIELAYIPQNVSAGRKPTLRERLAAIDEQLGSPLKDEFWKRNQLDLDFHQFANDELDRRIARIPDFGRRLQSFQARCQHLRHAA